MITTKQKIIVVCISLVLVGSIVLDHSRLPSISFNTSRASTDPLLQSNNLTYIGAFRVPCNSPCQGDSTSADFGGTGMSFNPSGNGGAGSLIISGFDPARTVGEISIPTPVNNSNLNSLPYASIVHPFSDVLSCHADDIYFQSCNTASVSVGGAVMYNGKLVVSVFGYFDTNAAQHPNSHFIAQGNFSGYISGPYQIGNNTEGSISGFVAGNMTPIPSAYQAALGGTYLTGQNSIPIIGRTSLGPSVTVFNPSDLGVVNPVPATRLIGYVNSTHPTLGAWDSTTLGTGQWNGGSTAGGFVFPANTRSVLFFGKFGSGPFCYGAGTSDPNLAFQPVPGTPGEMYCYDPTSTSKGPTSYPYNYHVWAYNADDLVAVKNGQKNYWDVLPYATWDINFPNVPATEPTDKQILGAGYDPATQRIYVVQHYADNSGGPLIQVFQINNNTPVTPAPTITMESLPPSISSGSSSYISWTTNNATSCTASGGWSGTKFTAGKVTVTPGSTTTYTLNCSGPGGSTTQSATVSLGGSSGAPTVSLSASPSSITAGQSSTLSWTSTNATSCNASGGWSGGLATSGSQLVSPGSTTSYTLTCSGSGGSANQSVTVTVGSNPPPTVSISAAPTSITSGSSSTLTWTSANATTCTASNGWSGSKAISGTQSVSPTSTTTYTLACTGSGGSANQSATVTVTTGTPPPPPPPPPPPSPPPGGMPVATDAFNRADANNLGSNWTSVYGGNSSLNGGSQGIKTNKAYADGATYGHSVAYWKSNSFNNDQYSQFTVESLNSGNHAFATVRTTGAAGAANGSGYEGYLDGTIMKMTPNGNFTQLAAPVGGGASGDVIRLNVVGNVLTLYRNGTQISTATDNSFASGSAGIGWDWFDYTPTIDNWEGGNLTSGSPLAGDLNLDHIINSLDWSIMNSKWFTNDATADINHDGLVNAIDFSILNANWFKTW